MTFAVALLLGVTSAAHLQSNNKALADEYLRQVYAQVGEVYNSPSLAQIDRRRRPSFSREEYKDYHNIYPPAEGVVAKLRGDPWPCSPEEPCAEGEGTCFNPHETRLHPDYYCEDGLWCQTRVGGSRGGPGEEVHGVVFSGALKMHHIGANDICFDPDWEGDESTYKMAVLRRKLRPCSAEDPCDEGEGDCQNNHENCLEGLSCAFRADEQVGPGEPIHGVEFIGDLLQTADGANDLCYNPHWPNTPDANYEGKLVRSCDQGNNNCDEEIYLVLDGTRRLVPDHTVWDETDEIIEKPHHAFDDLPLHVALCESTPVFRGDGDHERVFMMVEGKARELMNQETREHMQIHENDIQTYNQCVVDAFAVGIPIDYALHDEQPTFEEEAEVKGPATPIHADPYICGKEHTQTNCECNGLVVYGKPAATPREMEQSGFATRMSSGSIQCSNGVFGDPLPGVVKQCMCHPGQTLESYG